MAQRCDTSELRENLWSIAWEHQRNAQEAFAAWHLLAPEHRPGDVIEIMPIASRNIVLARASGSECGEDELSAKQNF